MPSVQGKIPKVYLPGRMTGRNTDGDKTNDSVIYRGRPYSSINALEMQMQDEQRELVRPARQIGLRVVGYYLTTGLIQPTE